MRKTKWFDFRSFFYNPSLTSSLKPRPIAAYSFVLCSPVAMIDPTILTIEGIVLGIAIIEWMLEWWGVINLANQFEKVMRFILPVTFYGALFYFFATFMNLWRNTRVLPNNKGMESQGHQLLPVGLKLISHSDKEYKKLSRLIMPR